MHTPAAILLALALPLGAAACGSDQAVDAVDSPTASSPASTSGATTPSDPATSATGGSDEPTGSAPTFGTGPVDGGFGEGNGLGLTGIRTGSQDGFDRIVFDLGGTGTPGFDVQYVDAPVSDGDGGRVRLDGTSFLQVTLHGIGFPDDIGIPTYGDATTRVPGTDTQGVAEIAPGAFFEGDQIAYVGLTGAQRPFRAFALSDPTRVVVDVRTP